MSERIRAKPETKRAPSDFGRIAVDIAASLGKSREEIAHGVGRKNRKTVDRLVVGEGSMAFARDVRELLKRWGADVSSLPALDDEQIYVLAPWLEEWIDLGSTLHRLAAPERFDQEVVKLRRLVEAHRVIAGETGEISRPNLSIAPSNRGG